MVEPPVRPEDSLLREEKGGNWQIGSVDASPLDVTRLSLLATAGSQSS